MPGRTEQGGTEQSGTEQSGTERARDERPLSRFAVVVTYTLNPFIFPPIILFLATAMFGSSGGEERVFLVAMVLYFVTPVAMLVVLRRAGRVETLEVRVRERRSAPFAAALVLSLLAIPAVWWAANGDPVVPWFAVLFALNLALLALINRRLKISIHAAGISGFAAFACWTRWAIQNTDAYTPTAIGAPWLVVLIGLTILVGWARMRIRAHTLREVASGTVFGFFVTLAELFILGKLVGPG